LFGFLQVIHYGNYGNSVIVVVRCVIFNEEAFLAMELVMSKDVRIIVEQQADGFVAYPIGLRGVIVGQGDTHDEAVNDVTSAIQFHVETFGAAELEPDEPLLNVFVTNARVMV
jgi:predicted RNase H-like HicB family nuclease